MQDSKGLCEFMDFARKCAFSLCASRFYEARSEYSSAMGKAFHGPTLRVWTMAGTVRDGEAGVQIWQMRLRSLQRDHSGRGKFKIPGVLREDGRLAMTSMEVRHGRGRNGQARV